MRSGAGLALLTSVAAALSGCGREEDVGYVEIRTEVKTGLASTATWVYRVNASELDDLRRKHVAIVKEPPGKARIDVERDGMPILSCTLDVRKNRVVTVTITGADRNLRCSVQT